MGLSVGCGVPVIVLPGDCGSDRVTFQQVTSLHIHLIIQVVIELNVWIILAVHLHRNGVAWLHITRRMAGNVGLSLLRFSQVQHVIRRHAIDSDRSFNLEINSDMAIVGNGNRVPLIVMAGDAHGDMRVLSQVVNAHFFAEL